MWDGQTVTGTEAPAGVYLCRVRVGSEVEGRTLVRLR